MAYRDSEMTDPDHWRREYERSDKSKGIYKRACARLITYMIGLTVGGIGTSLINHDLGQQAAIDVLEDRIESEMIDCSRENHEWADWEQQFQSDDETCQRMIDRWGRMWSNYRYDRTQICRSQEVAYPRLLRRVRQ